MKYKSGTMACSNFSWKGWWQKGIRNGQQCLRNLIIQFVGKLLRLRMTSSFECGQWETGTQILKVMQDWLWLLPSCCSGSDVRCGGMHKVCLARNLHHGGYALPVVHMEFCSPGRRKHQNPRYGFHGVLAAVAVVITRRLMVPSDWCFTLICYFTSWFFPSLDFCPELVLM